MIEDKELLKIYKQGFKDELDNPLEADLRARAYYFGRLDAIVGDDVTSSDEQTEEQILNKIKDVKYNNTQYKFSV